MKPTKYELRQAILAYGAEEFMLGAANDAAKFEQQEKCRGKVLTDLLNLIDALYSEDGQ